MPMDLLKKIASSRLPISFTAPEDIDAVRILRQAGLVVALIPAPADPLTLSGCRPAAQVLALTEGGRQELLRVDWPDEKLPGRRYPLALRERLRAAANRAQQALR